MACSAEFRWSAGGVVGAYQIFINAMVMSTPEFGTFAALNGPIRTAWRNQGGSNGPMGWPIADQRAFDAGGSEQRFQGGLVVVSAGGTVAVLSGVMFEYWSLGANSDALGNPTAPAQTWSAGGLTGQVQEFARELVPSDGLRATRNRWRAASVRVSSAARSLWRQTARSPSIRTRWARQDSLMVWLAPGTPARTGLN